MLDALTLYDFRNYAHLEAQFVPGVNLILGENAQGKTNLLEAVAYLSTGRSFRTAFPGRASADRPRREFRRKASEAHLRRRGQAKDRSGP